MFIQDDIYRHTQQLKMVLVLFVCAMILVIGCSDESFIGVEGHQLKTLRPWVSQSFSQNSPISDAFFLDHSALSKEGIQAFLERSPYGRSWLADYTVSGRSTSTMVYNISKLKGVNPILLLSRMQVEASLISASNRPAQHLIDRAMGCGCHDGRACQSRYLGLENQINDQQAHYLYSNNPIRNNVSIIVFSANGIGTSISTRLTCANGN